MTAADLVRFLFRWQHLAPGSRLHGADGVLQIVTQLQGYEISAAAWETQILDYTEHAANHTSGPIIANGKIISGRSCTRPRSSMCPS